MTAPARIQAECHRCKRPVEADPPLEAFEELAREFPGTDPTTPLVRLCSPCYEKWLPAAKGRTDG